MRLFYLISVWLHIVAAATWLGGIIFLVLVVVPALRRSDRATTAALMRDSGRRFRAVGWTCFGLLAGTGTFNLWFRGVRLGDLFDVTWSASAFGRVLWAKLAVFALVLVLSAVHDFVLGPRASRALMHAADGAQAERLRRAASWLGRLTGLLALALFAIAVLLVRGASW